MYFVLFFHVVCKISNFHNWTAKNLLQAFCTELTLLFLDQGYKANTVFVNMPFI